MACFGGIGNGGNMAFRRSVFDVRPVFDERLGKGVLANGDEHRAFGRLIADGYRAVYTPHAVVRHPNPQTAEAVRAEYLRSLADLSGYAMFLFLSTRFRWKVARYVLQAALGTKRTWRYRTAAVPPNLVPRWRRLLAYIVGTSPALRARLRPSRPLLQARLDDRARRRGSAETNVVSLTGK
jgi:hypothetical protein